MSAWFSDFGRFLWSVVDHWQAGVTGGVLPMIIFFLDKLVKKWRLKPWVYALIFGVGFLFMAFFSAWRSEHNAKVNLETTLNEERSNRFKPNLKFNVYNGGTGPYTSYRPNSTLLFLEIGARNIGTPTALRDWAVTFKTNTGTTYTGEITLFDKPVQLSGRSEEGSRTVFPEDFLPEKTLTPIPTGAETTGTLFAIINNLEAESIRETISTGTVTCRDVNDTPYTFTYEIRGHGYFNPYLRTPGMKRPSP